MKKCPENCSSSRLSNPINSTNDKKPNVEETYGFISQNDLKASTSYNSTKSTLKMGLGVSSEPVPATTSSGDSDVSADTAKYSKEDSASENKLLVSVINSASSKISVPSSSQPFSLQYLTSKPSCSSTRDESPPPHLMTMLSPLRSSYSAKHTSSDTQNKPFVHQLPDNLKKTNESTFTSSPVTSQGLAISLPSLYNGGEKGICHIHYRNKKSQHSHSNQSPPSTSIATSSHTNENVFSDSSTESESRPDSSSEESWCGMALGLGLHHQVNCHNVSNGRSSKWQIEENSHSSSRINMESRGENGSLTTSDNNSTSGCGHWCSACRLRLQVEVACVPGSQRPPNGNRRGLRTLSFPKRVRHKIKAPSKDLNGTHKKKKSPWSFSLNCRLKSNKSEAEQEAPSVSGLNVGCVSCVCPGYRHHETEPVYRSIGESSGSANKLTLHAPMVDLSHFNPEAFPIHDQEDSARIERAREMAEGVEPPPGFIPLLRENSNSLGLPWLDLQILLESSLRLGLGRSNISGITYPEGFMKHVGHFTSEAALFSRTVHTQVDYIHCLVPDLYPITNCGFYWGKMDRYEAERLLDNKPEGTFLLRDSVQEEYLFSVSFRRYERSLHARIEQWNHKFSFDSHDPSVFASKTVCGLIEHYKDPSCCMFFEPLLTNPLARTFPFTLQHLCRSVICSKSSYDGINNLELPKALKNYLKEYHYKQRVRVRHLD